MVRGVNVGNGDYDLTYSDFNPTVFFASKMRVTKRIAYHAHQDFTELTYILSGTSKYRIDDIYYDVKAGDMIVCNPGVFHQNMLLDGEEPLVEFCTGFTDYQFKNMPENTIQLSNQGHIVHLSSEAKREISRLCYDMLAENEAGQVGKYFMLKAQLIQMLMLLMREVIEAPKVIQKGCNFETYSKSYAVKRIINYLMENYAHKISLDQIAHNMYLSPVYISKIFKEETGESPINYLIKIRLEKAKEILSEREGGSIKNIANEIGYDDVYHFSKLFKKYFGISPQNYRKSLIAQRTTESQ
ncbi:MAG TPA: AraC family transcriptional regulator [Lachnoclostridium phytofermentans]|uniref:AraC family transcriptional regulator n=1 Tax=Lachnoclostridium phytofermentans TaxID=66219 RepID=A0A3D2X3I1_9FIRM|nr:AraC family transcriptional regulator [Lachnoclostridium sp.]HCL01536.1 AraC family transcriptional regulator [Lachnoclostridium phytofermentans]